MSSITIHGQPHALGELIGAGGMGRVYALVDPRFAGVAVKVLDASLAGNEAMVARMADEATTAYRVEHDNVVRMLDHGQTDEGLPYVAMARVDEAPLGELLRRDGALPMAQLRSVGLQILRGLAAIHRAGVVHNDLKSDNVLVDLTADHATIIDFGLAQLAAGAHENDTLVSGTPEYMAPERVRGGTGTPASDIYSVGVVVYEMLSGATPFCGCTPTAVFDSQLHDEVVPPSLRCPDRQTPSLLEIAILRALERQPQDRFADADAFACAIALAIPEDGGEACEARPRRVAFSTTAPTCDWVRHREASDRR